MREGLLVLACIALLLAAAGIMLWKWAVGRQMRRAAEKHLKQQIHASLTPSMPNAAPVGAPIAAAPAAGNAMLSDPWADAAAVEAVAAQHKPRLESLIPTWLEGAVGAPTLLFGIGAILALTVLAAAIGGAPAAGGAFLVLVPVGVFLVWLRLQKFRRKLVSQLPAFIDAMVRLITIGNSTQAAFQLAIASSRTPLRERLDSAAGLIRAGVDLDRALQQVAARTRVEEMFLLASILGLGVRYGGRADLLLERVSNFMRDREQAGQELVALSAETRLSAWILGLLPICVGAAIITMNPAYFLRMWHDGTGQYLVYGAVGMQLLGATLLYRLARFE